ncbi:secreted immunoglobulin domain 1 [Astyanax mexicanus]|uniref:secreted immunoglobulin domain 1 n=1 Tax=Astyanax mexicanus TaxID=7994 RepID=UPI001DD59F65|nr:secreted immunoglobulin domain 1 [Astyanax mexicanus]KAG9266703.1 secreted immunoglobulin domain 1 [Astyanax mexicanus]
MSSRTAPLLLLTLTLHCFLWQTSINLSVKPGKNVTLSCPLKTSMSIGIVSWYKQNPGEGPNMLLSYSITTPWTVRYAEGLNPHRYVVLARRVSRAHPRLRILTTQENDTATYYCSYSEKSEGQLKP